MNLVLEPDSAMVDDSEVQNQTGVGQRRIPGLIRLGSWLAAAHGGGASTAGRDPRASGQPYPWRSAARLGGQSAALGWISAA